MRNILINNKEFFDAWEEDGNDEKIKLTDFTKIKEFLYAGFIL